MKNDLKKQKAQLQTHVAGLRINTILLLAFSVVFLLVCLFPAPSEGPVLWLLLVFFALFLTFSLFGIWLPFYKLHKLNARLQGSQTTATETVTVKCKRVKFIKRDVKTGVLIIGIILTDEKNRELFYIYPKEKDDVHAFPFALRSTKRRKIKESLLGRTIVLFLLKGTDFIKYFSVSNR